MRPRASLPATCPRPLPTAWTSTRITSRTEASGRPQGIGPAGRRQGTVLNERPLRGTGLIAGERRLGLGPDLLRGSCEKNLNASGSPATRGQPESGKPLPAREPRFLHPEGRGTPLFGVR